MDGYHILVNKNSMHNWYSLSKFVGLHSIYILRDLDIYFHTIFKKVLLFSHCHIRPFSTPWTATSQAHLSFPASQSLPKFMPIESVMLSKHLIFCCPLLFLPSVFPSIRVFSNELALYIRWPKYWSFSFSISPSIEYTGLISFGIDWFVLLAVQGTVKNLLRHHNSKASILGYSAFFKVQLSHLYMTTGKDSFDYTDLCLKNDGSAFECAV